MSDEEASHMLYITAKRTRNQIEADTQILENRIRLMRREESRAHKRIQNSREIITAVKEARSRSNFHKYNDQLLKEKINKDITNLKEQVRSTRSVNSIKNEFIKKELFFSKQNIGQRVRKWKEFIKVNKKLEQEKSLRQNQNFKECVVTSARYGAFRSRFINGIKLSKGKEEYALRVDTENAKRATIEEKIILLQKQEQDLVQRVNNIQKLQQKIGLEYEELL